MSVKSSKTNSKSISSRRKRDKQRFGPGQIVEQSGVYEAFHAHHRLSHQVQLIAEQEFPLCSRCKEKVRFELVRANPELNEKTSPLVHVIGVFVPEAA